MSEALTTFRRAVEGLDAALNDPDLSVFSTREVGILRQEVGKSEMTYLTPSELDREHFRWTRWKPQHGGFDNGLWRGLQDEWRKAVTHGQHAGHAQRNGGGR